MLGSLLKVQVENYASAHDSSESEGCKVILHHNFNFVIE